MAVRFPPKEEVLNKIDQAIRLLLENDAYLLEIDANERTISHRLGLYLQFLFKDWDVDCEYNRALDNTKRLKAYKSFLFRYKDQLEWNIAEKDPITVFPDIIIHKRGTHANLAIIEIKKTTSKVGCDYDYHKLEEFKYQYGYKHALFLRLITGCEDIGIDKKQYLPDKT